MRLDCGHWTDTSSLCHTVCQQQAPCADDDEHGHSHGDEHDDGAHDEGEHDDDALEEDGDVIFFSLLVLHPIPTWMQWSRKFGERQTERKIDFQPTRS